MSTEVGTIPREKAFSLAGVPAWLWLGIAVYALVLAGGGTLLDDSDTYWQIAVGQQILNHGALPRVDVYSFSKLGEPWISSSWLAQVLYALKLQSGRLGRAGRGCRGLDRCDLRAARVYPRAPHSRRPMRPWSR